MMTETTMEMQMDNGETLTLVVTGEVEPRRSGYRGRMEDSFADEGGVYGLTAINAETGEEVSLNEWEMDRAAEKLMEAV